MRASANDDPDWEGVAEAVVAGRGMVGPAGGVGATSIFLRIRGSREDGGKEPSSSVTSISSLAFKSSSRHLSLRNTLMCAIHTAIGRRPHVCGALPRPPKTIARLWQWPGNRSVGASIARRAEARGGCQPPTGRRGDNGIRSRLERMACVGVRQSTESAASGGLG